MSKSEDRNICFPARRGLNQSLLNSSQALCDGGTMDRRLDGDAQQGSIANRLESNEDGENKNWFEEANCNVVSVTSAGDESPFYLGDLVSLPVTSEVSPAPENPILSYMRNQDENNELRDIIDDLTIEIKELKRKLHRYKKIDIQPMHVDKVMEVRTHGLSTSKKRQLEDILKEFTANEIFGGYHPSNNPITVVEKLEQAFLALDDPVISETWCPPASKNVEGPSPERVKTAEDLGGGLANSSSEQRYKDNEVSLNPQTIFDLYQAVESNDLPFDEDGWMKLDLLVKIARLSATNVTPEYAQYCVRRFSKQLILSSDGRRVKWKTDVADAVRLSASYSSSSTSEGMLPLGMGGPRKVSRVEKESSNYKPVVFTDDDESIKSASDASEPIFDSEEMTGGLDSRSAGKKSTSPRSRPISFYKDAAFCVDLSCDGLDLNKLDDYLQSESMTTRISRQGSKHASRFDKFSSLSKELAQSDMSEKINENISDQSLSGLDTYSLTSTSFDEEGPSPFELEASGTGGVVPADNFAIYVRVKHARTAGTDKLPSSIGFARQIGLSKICEQHVVSARHEQLVPSPLPPATFTFFSSSSSTDRGGSTSEEHGSE